MRWESMKMILATTATAAVASQIVYKLYRKLRYHEINIEAKETCTKPISAKDREINDAIIFTDQRRLDDAKAPLSKDVKPCKSREVNCIKLIQYIKSAKETLDVCMYLITSDEIAEHIIRLGEKHVLVRILVDSDMAHTEGSQVKRLEQYSFIKVQKSKRSALMHHKFCIVDGPAAVKRKNQLKAHAEKVNIFGKKNFYFYRKSYENKKVKGFVMSGSLNWSTQAMVGNYDNVIITSSENVVAKFEKEFAKLWEDKELVLG